MPLIVQNQGQAAVSPHSRRLGEGLKETSAKVAESECTPVIKLHLVRISLSIPSQILIKRVN